MRRPAPCVTLLTDFGLSDGYVGAMKGALLRVNPRACVVDLTHLIPPQSVRAAAFVLAQAYAAFPPGAIHVVVVDPGVGSDRRLLAVRLGAWYFLAPDNGVLGLVQQREPLREAVTLRPGRYTSAAVSATFHGRDILAPMAGHLSLGVPLRRLGPPIRTLQSLHWPSPRRTSPSRWAGHVIHTDHYGNVITNLQLPSAAAAGGWAVQHRRRAYPVLPAYASAVRNAILAAVGSHGYLELAVRDGSAQRRLRARRDEPVALVRLARRSRKEDA